MKKNNILLPTLFVATLLAGCGDDALVPADDPATAGMHEVTASILSGNPDAATRTSMGALSGSTYPVNWSAGDRFGVMAPGKYPYTLVSLVSPYENQGRFSGMSVDAYPGTKVYPAAYPYRTAFAQINTLNSSEILVGAECPQVQSYGGDASFATDTYPMAAASTNGLSYSFRNLCGVLQIPILGEDSSLEGVTNKIATITLEGNDREKIAGKVAMAFNTTTGAPVASVNDQDYNCKVVLTDEGKERVIVDFGADGLTVNNLTPKVVNIALLPTVFEHGFTITFTDFVHGGTDVHKSVDNVQVWRSWTTEMQPVTYNRTGPIVPANCYINSEPGYDMHPAYCMGNRLSLQIPTEGRNVDCDLLWIDTDPAAISDIEYLQYASGRGMFSYCINEDPTTHKAYRGNAVIALYDVDTKEILWTWHIWMTEEPSVVETGGYCAEGAYEYTFPGYDVKYNYHAEAVSKGSGLEIMDRNLGAISANQADGWKTYGLYYQDGRRDPFVGAWGFNGSRTQRDNLYTENSTTGIIETEEKIDSWQLWETTAFSYGAGGSEWGTLAYDFGSHTWWNTELTEGWKTSNTKYMTLTESIRNPMTYSNGQGGTYDPQWTNCNDEDNRTYMDPTLNDKGQPNGKNPNLYLDQLTGLSMGGHQAYWNRAKTIMDPCPAGWSLLGESALLGDDTVEAYTNDVTGVSGLISTFNGKSVWWPAAGARDCQGRICDVGYRGSYWYYDHIAASHGGHGWSFTMVAAKGAGYTTLTPVTAGVMTNHASSLRCVREKQTHHD